MLQRVHNLSSLAMPEYRPVSIAKLWELSLKRLSASLYLQLVIKSKYLARSVSCLKRQYVCNFVEELSALIDLV